MASGSVAMSGSAALIISWIIFVSSSAKLVLAEYVATLDGVQSYISAPLPSQLSSGDLFSLSFWVKAAASDTGSQAIFSLAGSELKRGMTIGVANGLFYYSDNYLGMKMSDKRHGQRWHLVTLTMEEVDRGSYLDQAGERPAHRDITLSVDNEVVMRGLTLLSGLAGGEIIVGAEYHYGEKRNYFEGSVDELRVYRSSGNSSMAEDLFGMAFLRWTPGKPEDLISYYDFNQLSPNKDGSVQRLQNIVPGGVSAVVAYTTKSHVDRMPYDPVELTEVESEDLYPFANANFLLPRALLGGINITVTGYGFCDSNFLSVSIQDGDIVVKGRVVEYIDSHSFRAELPPYNRSGSLLVQVSNGGYNFKTTPWLAEYVPGVEMDESLQIFFPFNEEFSNAVDRANVTYMGSMTPSATFTEDRNGRQGQALDVSLSKGMLEFAAVIQGQTSWSLCAWVNVKPGNWTLFSEYEIHKRSGPTAVHNISIIDNGEAGYGSLALDGIAGGRLAWSAWQHICVATNDAEVAFYTSGILTGTAEAPMSVSAYSTVAYLGENLEGLLDDVMIWNRTIRQLDARQLFMLDSAAVEFDGSPDSFIRIVDDGLDVPKFSSSTWRPRNAFSIEMWVRPAGVERAATQTLFAQGTTIVVTLERTILVASIRHSSSDIRTVSSPLGALKPGRWSLVGVSYNGQLLRLVVNGKVVQDQTFNTGTIPASSASLILARDFAGLVGEIRLWSTDLSLDNFQEYYTCPPSPTGSRYLYACFPMEDGTGRLYFQGSKLELKLNVTTPGGTKPFWTFSSYVADISTTVFPLSTADGEGLRSAVAGGTSYFTVQTRGECGRLRHEGGTGIQGIAVGPTDIHNYDIYLADITDNDDGTYTGTYSNVTGCGSYNLRIESSDVPEDNMRVQDVADSVISGSPFRVEMEPGATDATMSYLLPDPSPYYNNSYGYGGSSSSSLESVEGTVSFFLLQTVDSYGCLRNKGGDVFNVTISGRYNGTGSSEDLGDGTYRISYIPRTVGPLRVEVTLDGVHVGRSEEFDIRVDCTTTLSVRNKGSPLCVNAVPGRSLRFGAALTGLSEVVVEAADHLNLNRPAFTIQAWVMPDGSPEPQQGRQVVVGKMSRKSGQGYWLGLNSPSMTAPDGTDALAPLSRTSVNPRYATAGVYVGSSTYRTIDSNISIPYRLWSHIAMTYDGRRLKLFVNGSLAGAQEWDDVALAKENSQPLVIGRNFTGLIDEVLVTASLLGSAEIAYTMTCPVQSNSEVLGWWRFNEPAGNVTYDSSDFAADGILYGNLFTGIVSTPVYGAPPKYGYQALLDEDTGMDAHSLLTPPSSAGKLSTRLSQALTTVEKTSDLAIGETIAFNITLADECGYFFPVNDIDRVAAHFKSFDFQWSSAVHKGLKHPLEVPRGSQQTDIGLAQPEDLCTRSGLLQGRFSPPICGSGKLIVTVDGQPVIATQTTTLGDVAAAANTSAVIVPFGGLNAGQQSVLWIAPNDIYGCPVSRGDDSFVVLLTRISMGRAREEMWQPDSAAVHAVVEWDVSKAMYEALFTPPAPGNYTITVGLKATTADGGRYETVRTWSAPFLKKGNVVADSIVVEAAPSPWRSVYTGEAAWGTPSPATRYGPTTAVYDGRMFIFSGWSADKSPATDVWEYPLGGPASLGTYLYKKTFTIENLEEPIEVRLSFPTAELLEQGKIRGDCADFVFVDNATGVVIPHWLDPVPGCGSPDAGFWMRAPSAPSSSITCFFGSAGTRPPAGSEDGGLAARASKIFTLFDGFEDGEEPLSNGWEVASTCSLPLGDPNALSAIANWTDQAKPGDTWSLKVDTEEDKRGGSFAKPLPNGLSLESYVLRAQFYDSDAVIATHWISPDFDDCAAPVAAGAKRFPTGSGLGIYSSATPSAYAMMFPWKSTGVPRTAGWHSFELCSNGLEITYKVDDVEVGRKKLPGPLSRVFVRGGGPIPMPEASGWWDNIFVARYDPQATVTAGPEETVVWENKRWTRVPARGKAPPVRSAGGGVQYEDVVYLIGGFETDRYENKTSIWSFDFTSYKWSQVKPWGSIRPPALEDHTVTLYADLAVVFGGRFGAAAFADIWLFSLKDTAWLPPIRQSGGPSPRFGHSAVMYGDSLYVFGGFVPSEGRATADVFAFDFLTKTWGNLTRSIPGPSPRYGHSASVRGSSMYISGGAEDVEDGRTTEVWRFDFNYNRWQRVAAGGGKEAESDDSDSRARQSPGAVMDGLNLLLFGGYPAAAVPSMTFTSVSVY